MSRKAGQDYIRTQNPKGSKPNSSLDITDMTNEIPEVEDILDELDTAMELAGALKLNVEAYEEPGYEVVRDRCTC